MGKYSQSIILKRLNHYLDINQRDLKLENGYCHGFSLLWLYHMTHNNEAWFYDVLHQIARCRTKKHFQKIATQVEWFIAHLEWLQNSKSYVNSINQMDIDDLLEMPKISLSFQFTKQQLYSTLRKIIHPNEMICISGPTHTIGIYFRDNDYYLFDPNYSDGKAHVFTNLRELRDEIIRCLIKGDVTKETLLPIEINIARSQTNQHGCNEALKSRLLEMLIAKTDDIDQEGPSGATALYLAIETGDLKEVKRLIECGANPNHLGKNGWTPLQAAVYFSYKNITRLLLRYGADANQTDPNGLSSLHLAAQQGDFRSVKLLMQHGAAISPDHPSAIHSAVKHSHWQIAAFLLANCRLSTLSKHEIKLLKKNYDVIKREALMIQPQLIEKQQLRLTRNMNELRVNVNFIHRLFSTKLSTATPSENLTKNALRQP